MALINRLIGLVLLAALSSSAQAYSSKDEQIDYYLEVLSQSNVAAKIQMLERLQWSGLTDPRLYDVVEANVISQFQNDLNSDIVKVLSFQVRALGYSGNEKYKDTLKRVKADAKQRKIRSHAKRALRNLRDFTVWNKIVADSEIDVDGKPVEIATYMKMLNADNTAVQKLAARAIFHEGQTDTELLELAAGKLRGMYLEAGLNRNDQDTAAWLSKAIGKSGGDKYLDLLTQVVEQTPYKKIRKYAKKYIP